MLEGWTPNQQSLNWSCIVHSWKCLFHLSALFYSEPNNLCLLKMFSDLWFHCQLGKGFGSIHTSFRNRRPLRYNLVKLLLQCTNGTQTQTGGGQRGKGEGPYPLERATRLWRKISWKGASLGAASFPGGLHDPVVPWGLRVNAPTEMPEGTACMPGTPQSGPPTQRKRVVFIQEVGISSSHLSYLKKYCDPIR